jgi:hypothetical protein
MSSSADLHLAYRIANAPVLPYPYPHFFVRDVFPQEYYEALQAMLPDPGLMTSLLEARGVRGYDQRFVMDLTPASLERLDAGRRTFWQGLHDTLIGGAFARVLLRKFGPLVKERFEGRRVSFHEEALLVQDTTQYSLGPHTDTPRKVLTLLFYLPRDHSQSHLGTSMYVPRDRAFRCPGGPHHSREGFERVWTMPFLPNSLFVFLKTSDSFHGVEPVLDPDCRRWLLLYDIYHHVSPAPAVRLEPGSANDVTFSF